VTATVRSSQATSPPDPEWLINQIAHALRNPIFAATVQAEALLLKVGGQDALARSATMIQGQLKRLADDLDEMLLLGRPARLSVRMADLAGIAVEVARSFCSGPTGDRAAVEVRGAATLPLMCDPDAVRAILERLVRNAAQHSQAAQVVDLEVTGGEGGGAVLAVRDRGEGIAPELLDKIFLPFFPQHRGRPGLGLTVAAKLAHALGGYVEISSEPGAGTTARLVLPASPPAAGP